MHNLRLDDGINIRKLAIFRQISQSRVIAVKFFVDLLFRFMKSESFEFGVLFRREVFVKGAFSDGVDVLFFWVGIGGDLGNDESLKNRVDLFTGEVE